MGKTGKKKVTYLILILLLLIVLTIMVMKLSEIHKVYRLIDPEDPKIYYGMTVDQLKKIKGDPQNIIYNIGDTLTDKYIYEEIYMGKPAEVGYYMNPNLEEYSLIITNLTEKEGEEVFDKTAELCKKLLSKTTINDNKIVKGSKKKEGKISVSCSKYGLALNSSNEGRTFEWKYKDGEFNLSVTKLY